ncbi:LysR substrate-binding domain-containing protein [Paraburkholderia sp.]|uniref:LysR substrate-binding domain-containing protein n=1 Tax=Paraburkholderia sp. TaxID=1926495 RepID=UPI002F3E9213
MFAGGSNPPSLQQARREYDSHRCHHAVEGTLDRLIKLLEDGDLDIALGRNRVTSTQTSLVQETLYREPFVFITGASHPLGAPEREVDWKDLDACRWITPLHGSPAYATLIEALSEHGAAPAAGSVESSSLHLPHHRASTGTASPLAIIVIHCSNALTASSPARSALITNA